MSGWRVAVDRGGTFTDVVALDPQGGLHVAKLLASGLPERRALDELLPPGATLDELRVGTTVATNALLTGRGARAALLITAGFGDLLQTGHGARPDIFALHPQRLPPLAERTVEVHERVAADGGVECPLDEGRLAEDLERLRADGVTSLGVALLHAWIAPEHEQRVEALARAAGFESVSLSSSLAPTPGLLDRAWTAEADAFTSPVLRRYLDTVQALSPPRARLLAMKSSGGLGDAADLRGVHALLSGPAGGVVACSHVARELGLDAVLGFDMGGTSTDVCRWAGDIERSHRLDVAGRSLRIPTLDLVTVAAGGGSRLARVDDRLVVGPDSVGADPGPAAYGRGGPAALTDANVVLGRLQPDFFPRSFGPDRSGPLDGAGAAAAVEAAAGAIPPAPEQAGAGRGRTRTSDGAVGPGTSSAEHAAAGYIAVANAAIASAISELSTARGHDPARHALLAFGGAAGQHACAVARRLGMDQVVFHPLAGVLSALGIARAPRVATRSTPIQAPWSEALAASGPARAAPLLAACRAELARGGAVAASERIRWALRYAGSDTELDSVDRADFEAQHRRLFGFARADVPVEACQLRVELRSGVAFSPSARGGGDRSPPPPSAVRRVGFPDREGALRWCQTPVFHLDDLPRDTLLSGPALVASPTTTVLLDPGWIARVFPDGALLAKDQGRPSQPRSTTRRDPVRLELYHRRFMSLATRMGETLRRVAWSVNIKERLDFSCALFDAAGGLVANAPHIPVHLGAMGETVRELAGRLGPALEPGRTWAVNDPRSGGSHLPDVTVITPVFAEGGLVGWVANRGHHADLGGRTPGSMPPDSRSLAEEGVILRDLCLVDGGVWQEDAVRHALLQGGGAWPARQPAVNVADLQAQVAANALGARLLQELVDLEGAEVLAAWTSHVQDNAAEAVQGWLEGLGAAPCSFADAMDDGTVVAVCLRRTGRPGRRRLDVDFSGTGPRSPTNLNAPSAVVRAAVLYVLRCAIGRDIPLNEGCLRAIDLRLPPGSLFDPAPWSAVVGGNVETSQRVVDVLLGALGLLAACQGTMNNLTLGTSRGAYYETIPGGVGAGEGQPGASALQSHMTNTRLTDVEVLELRFPVQVRRFALRTGSGGAGQAGGGEGVVRTLRFLEPVDVALLSQRRSRTPFGLHGGEAGAPGRAELRSRGVRTGLPACFSRRLDAGDELELHTPGGGGFGALDGADM